MLLLHEVHRVAGASEDAFDEAYRDGLMPALAQSDGSRLLWFLRVAHGSGPAYTIITITGCRDAYGVGRVVRASARRRPGRLVGGGGHHAARP